MKVICRVVVHFDDSLVLVRKTKTEQAVPKWRLAERTLEPDESLTDCVRLAALQETGYMAKSLQLLDFSATPKTETSQGVLRFLFGAQVDATPIHQAPQIVRVFSTEEILHLSADGHFKEPFLLDTIYRYKSVRIAPRRLPHHR